MGRYDFAPADTERESGSAQTRKGGAWAQASMVPGSRPPKAAPS